MVQQEKTPSWGLARLSSSQKLTNDTSSVYRYDQAAAGEGTTAYIVDTGILAEHEVFIPPITVGICLLFPKDIL